ncbi:myb/SANT-like DNA-binding domain-containing protein 3 isoform X1 [Ischnura elegans]|uniref:myb/SANT-like DNA-binding domain-containing protein 3 isoform X1 n=1 Tax=Ischnura elegans TaxID=197161 RepID=UPI001ED8BB4A|nr:myb/SANT-like DNA-binding domain-containing protein 3 isoform X1 [Ischnura elegans]
MEDRRMVRLTREETKLLVDIIVKHQEVLESKKTDALSNAKKAKAWLDVQEEFNSNEFVRKRTAKQLRKSWDNLKMRKRKELADERQERMRTGGGPMPSTSREDLPPEMEIAMSSISYSPPNAGDCDALPVPSVSTVGRVETSECLLPPNVSEISDCDERPVEEAYTPRIQGAGTSSSSKRARFTREAAIEKEMEARLEHMASYNEKEDAIQRIRKREAEIACAIKEQELANAKAAGKTIQMEEEFKRRILSIQLQTEEAKRKRVVLVMIYYYAEDETSLVTAKYMSRILNVNVRQ